MSAPSTDRTKRKPLLRREPVSARVIDKTRTDEAWFYENARSLDVYTYRVGIGGMSCRITLAQIEAWLKRVKT